MLPRKSIIACLTFFLSVLSVFPAEIVLGAWGDGEHQVAIIQDGKRFFIQTEAGRMGPYDYVSPVAREQSPTNRCFITVTKKQYFLVSLSGERFGPYEFIHDDATGRIFKCSRPTDARLYDLYYDDGTRLVPIGTTSLIVDDADCRSSADGKHYGVFAGGLTTDPEYVYYDGSMLPINHHTTMGVWDIGFVGGGASLWLKGEESPDGALLLFVESSGPDGKVLVSTLTEAAGYEGNRMPFPEALLGRMTGLDGREPLRISTFGKYCRSFDGRWIALSLKTGKGWYFYGGRRLFGPYKHDVENGKLPMAISRDGRSMAYVVRGQAPGSDAASGPLRYLVYKDGSFLGAHDAKICDIDLDGDSGACVYTTKDDSGKYAAWVDGKLAVDGCTEASLDYVEDYSAPDAQGKYFDYRFLGHFSIRKDGETRLYRLGAQVGEAFAVDGHFFLRKVAGGNPVPFYVEDQGEGKFRLVSGAYSSEPLTGIAGIRVSDSGGTIAYDAKDGKGSWSVVVGGKSFGPYDSCSAVCFIPGKEDAVFFYAKGKSWFLGRSDGTSSALPGFGYAPRSDTDLSAAPVVSPDGRVVDYPAAGNFYYYQTGKSFLVDSRRVLVDGLSHPGTYNPAARVTIYWDEKAKAFVTIHH